MVRAGRSFVSSSKQDTLFEMFRSRLLSLNISTVSGPESPFISSQSDILQDFSTVGPFKFHKEKLELKVCQHATTISSFVHSDFNKEAG